MQFFKCDGAIAHGELLTEEHVRSYSLAPMLIRQIEKWRSEHGLEPSAVRILDYGCGRGRMVYRLRDQGYEAYGVDIDRRPVENGRPLAKARGLDADRVLTVLDEAGRTDYPDDFFDLTTSFQVFEHVQEIDRSVAELARITKPGGGGIHVFPPRAIPIEGHLSMPFVHWLPKNRSRYWLIRLWVALGVESNPPDYAGLDAKARAEKYFRFVVDRTQYWSRRRVAEAYRKAGLRVRFVSIESPRVRDRLGSLLAIPGVDFALNELLSRCVTIHALYEKPHTT